MLVYGDSSRRCRADAEVEAIAERVAAARLAGFVSCAELRRWLVLFGRLEQGVADVFEEGAAVRASMAATDLAARLLYRARAPAEVLGELERRTRALGDVLRDAKLTLKVPEGFSFYLLYPEQYFLAAARFARASSAGHALVIGVRSIGTALSAAVAAALEARGWTTERLTVRPTGHPFDRRVTLSTRIRGAHPVLIADEGPGLSGSSMAAVARAVVGAGARPEQIHFFPGHAGDPGPHASIDTRAWWSRTPRWHARFEAGAERLSGGKFDRPTLRFDTESGQSVLARFYGFISAPEARSELARVADLGFGPRPLGERDGFVLIPWVEGRPLEIADASPRVLDRIADYLVLRRGEVLSAEELSAAEARTQALLQVNGRVWMPLPPRRGLESRYCDGCMMPRNWIAGDRLLKLDPVGHDEDHSFAGPQPEIWDVAGTIVEWELSPELETYFLRALAVRGRAVSPQALAYYRAAYALHRAGIASVA